MACRYHPEYMADRPPDPMNACQWCWQTWRYATTAAKRKRSPAANVTARQTLNKQGVEYIARQVEQREREGVS
jgi:hypothetical protein